MYFLAKKENNTAVNNNDNSDFFEVRLPKIYGWIGAVASVFFISLFILMILFPNDTASAWVGVTFIGFALLGLSLVITNIKWKIQVYENHIVYINMWGRPYKYDYSEIKSVKLTPNSLKIKTTSKVFRVDPHVIGLEVILNRFDENNVTISYI